MSRFIPANVDHLCSFPKIKACNTGFVWVCHMCGKSWVLLPNRRFRVGLKHPLEWFEYPLEQRRVQITNHGPDTITDDTQETRKP